MITARSALSEAEIAKGFKIHFKNKNRFMRYAPFLGGLLILSGLHLAINNKLSHQASIVFLPALFFLFYPQIMMWLVKRNIRKLRTLNNMVFWQLDEEGLKGNGQGFEFSSTWAIIYEALISNEGLLLYPQSNAFHWIPASAFEEGYFEKAKELVRTSIKSCKAI